MQRHRHRIIIEGVDGSGKTVLNNRLLREVPNLKPVRNEKNDIQNFSEWWPSVIDEEEDGTVPLHDRFFYSELVYGPVIRGHLAESATPILVANISWFLRGTAFLIYARPHSSSIKESVKVEQQMSGVHEKLAELIESYDTLMLAEKTWYDNSRFFHYDWRKGEEHYQSLLRSIESYFKMESPVPSAI